MRLPPTHCPPGPRVLPPILPPKDTPLHPLFSSSGSSFSSSLSPVQCELGLGRIHWQTLLLDLLFFISHNQRRKGQLTRGRARDHRAHVLQKVLPTRIHTHTHTRPRGLARAPVIFISTAAPCTERLFLANTLLALLSQSGPLLLEVDTHS